MKMMKVFDAPYEPKEVWNAWCDYNESMGQRGYISVCVDDYLGLGEVDEELPPYKVIYDWLIANGAEHGETVLVEFDW